jgi:hypothetical protein
MKPLKNVSLLPQVFPSQGLPADALPVFKHHLLKSHTFFSSQKSKFKSKPQHFLSAGKFSKEISYFSIPSANLPDPSSKTRKFKKEGVQSDSLPQLRLVTKGITSQKIISISSPVLSEDLNNENKPISAYFSFPKKNSKKVKHQKKRDKKEVSVSGLTAERASVIWNYNYLSD